MREYYIDYRGKVTELNVFAHSRPDNWAFCISPIPSENAIIVRRNALKFNRAKAAKLVNTLRESHPKVREIDYLTMHFYIIPCLEKIAIMGDSSVIIRM